MISVGLCGPQEVGKSTLAKNLVKHHGFLRISMAGTLKDAICAAYGCTRIDCDDPDFKRSSVVWAWTEAANQSVAAQFGIGAGDLWRVSGQYAGRIYDTPREALQQIGTDILRAYQHDIHLTAAKKALSQATTNVVCDDVRFPNELALFAQTYWLVRSGHTPKEVAHASDCAITESDCRGRYSLGADRLENAHLFNLEVRRNLK